MGVVRRSSARKVVISSCDAATLVQRRLLHLVCIQVFEKITFLALIIAHVEGIPSHVLMLPVKVLDHRQCVVVGASAHGRLVASTASTCIDSIAKAVLVADLTW